MLEETTNLNNLLEEIEILKNRSKLLDYILNHYDIKTGTFNIPEKWNTHHVLPEKLPAPNPRAMLKKKMNELLTDSERNRLNIDSVY